MSLRVKIVRTIIKTILVLEIKYRHAISVLHLFVSLITLKMVPL